MDRNEIAQALKDVRINYMPMPEARNWSSPWDRGVYEQVWPGLSLEQQVSDTAMVIGYPVYDQGPLGIISAAYLNLCHSGNVLGVLADVSKNVDRSVPYAAHGITDGPGERATANDPEVH